VFGDQLDQRATLLRELNSRNDAVLMMEVSEESTHVPSHKQRTVLFLSAMRHFALDLAGRNFRVRYVKLDARGNTQSFTGEVKRAVRTLRPQRLALTHPGEWRVREMIQKWERGLGLPIELYPDEHFTQSLEDFSAWAGGRKQLVMEYFYRERRKKLGILLESDGKPVGGQWNYDQENRQSFKEAPRPPKRYVARPDDTTKEVIRVVEKHFPNAPGRIDSFGWPVTRSQAKKALANFVDNRLEHFGRYQDAMWLGESWLYHSTISPCLNLKLLSVEECVEAALDALKQGKAPLNSVEGFIRQLIGWREFIRGVYWHEGSGYGLRNTLEQHGSLPEFYWTGETGMVCMRESLGQVIEHAYGHHIQRLMVTGNFALISGIQPRAIADWYLGMYVDAVDWVTTPNTVGMVMHADGGVVGTKPYAASGRYIQRMSNYCSNCRYDPTKRTGEGAGDGEGAACPFTTFYWDFLIRNHDRFRANRRMAMILKNVDRMSGAEVVEIEERAKRLREEYGIGWLKPRAPERRAKG
jgi:deoxyribodipyrimidine photolyase-related protein